MYRVALAALAASAVLFAAPSLAQQPSATPAPPLVDWDKIQIKTTDLGANTYMLQGQGGNITVAVGTDGIIMVDGQFAPLSDKIKAAIKAVAPLPVKYMVNTHFHGDHTGGNDNFAKDGVTIVAHDNIRVRLAAGTTAGLTGNRAAPRAPEALPKQTYLGAARWRWRWEAAGRSSRTLPMRTPTATPGSISRTPTCSRPATPSTTTSAIRTSTSPTAAMCAA
jgi:glyoxylase-like metal-dependent hydrolase (beta-lactamase superfamily II)